MASGHIWLCSTGRRVLYGIRFGSGQARLFLIHPARAAIRAPTPLHTAPAPTE